jgi:hypothetical protein
VRELHALIKLTHVQLLDVVRCRDGIGLVLDRLEDVAYGPMKKDVNESRGSPHQQLPFSQKAVHSRGVAHCDVKPEAFVRRPWLIGARLWHTC